MINKIHRYHANGNPVEYYDGEFVRHSDHLTVVAKLKAENAELRAKVDRFKDHKMTDKEKLTQIALLVATAKQHFMFQLAPASNFIATIEAILEDKCQPKE